MFQQPGLAPNARQGAMPSHGLKHLVLGELRLLGGRTLAASRVARGSTQVTPLPQAGAVELGDELGLCPLPALPLTPGSQQQNAIHPLELRLELGASVGHLLLEVAVLGESLHFHADLAMHTVGLASEVA